MPSDPKSNAARAPQNAAPDTVSDTEKNVTTNVQTLLLLIDMYQIYRDAIAGDLAVHESDIEGGKKLDCLRSFEGLVALFCFHVHSTPMSAEQRQDLGLIPIGRNGHQRVPTRASVSAAVHRKLKIPDSSDATRFSVTNIIEAAIHFGLLAPVAGERPNYKPIKGTERLNKILNLAGVTSSKLVHGSLKSGKLDRAGGSQ